MYTAGRAGWRSDRDGEPGVGDKREPWVEGGGPGWKEDGSRPAGSSYYPSKRNPNRRWDDGDVLPEWWVIKLTNAFKPRSLN